MKIEIGTGALTILALIFITLKLLDKIAWSWLWVLSPIWIPIVLWVLVGAIVLIVGAILLI